MEKDIIDPQQYIRRNNIEICGMPTNIPDHELEQKVISLAAAIDVKIKKSDIEACHRLHDKNNDNGPKKTIVRFTNRRFNPSSGVSLFIFFSFFHESSVFSFKK